jgi:hypothetical protein
VVEDNHSGSGSSSRQDTDTHGRERAWIRYASGGRSGKWGGKSSSASVV